MSRHALTLIRTPAVIIRLMDRRKSAPVTELPVQPVRDLGPGMTAGKHVDDGGASTLLALVQPQRFFCLCGERATHVEPSVTRGARPRYYCPDHRPLGILGVVDGGGGDAA